MPESTPRTTLVTTKSALREHRVAMDGTVAAVLTMGSLHAGHLALVERARELADHVILTDFVNPLQFGPGEDYEAYPRDLEADLALVDGLVDLVFAPGVEEMYPVMPPTVSVSAGRAGTVLEGAARPGHFDGVVTVVAKLLRLTDPHLSVFGRKDAQQLAIIKLWSPTSTCPCGSSRGDQREETGLARSSRSAISPRPGRSGPWPCPHDRRGPAAPSSPASRTRWRPASAPRSTGTTPMPWIRTPSR